MRPSSVLAPSSAQPLDDFDLPGRCLPCNLCKAREVGAGRRKAALPQVLFVTLRIAALWGFPLLCFPVSPFMAVYRLATIVQQTPLISRFPKL